MQTDQCRGWGQGGGMQGTGVGGWGGRGVEKAGGHSRPRCVCSLPRVEYDALC